MGDNSQRENRSQLPPIRLNRLSDLLLYRRHDLRAEQACKPVENMRRKAVAAAGSRKIVLPKCAGALRHRQEEAADVCQKLFSLPIQIQKLQPKIVADECIGRGYVRPAVRRTLRAEVPDQCAPKLRIYVLLCPGKQLRLHRSLFAEALPALVCIRREYRCPDKSPNPFS